EVWWNTSSSGTYRLAKTTASTSFTKTYLQPGARYFFKVRAYQTVVNKWIAYGDRAYGDFSPAVSGVPLAKPVILSAVSAARGRVSLAWAAVAGAGGYRISAAPTPAGTYAPLAATAATAYTLTGLRPGTVYYFKVTAFRKYYTATYYGPESGYKGVKTRVR
ncbi:MAG TPA: hypothetical protein VLA21_11955, partial [Candidatus Limnocylindria bacterium]|nr:hypothetical protein [Candidatus Limnocylindria bacterium]